MLRPVLLLLLLLRTSTAAVNNDATESISLQPQLHQHEQHAEEEANEASNGGIRPRKAAACNDLNQSQVGCRELRSTKYISDGQCTSVKPIKELVCAGECLPNHLLPNWIGGSGRRYWSQCDAQEWRCIIDRNRTQRIQLQCHDGSSRTYKITVVTSCKCKRSSRQQNDSGHRVALGAGASPGASPRKNQARAAPPEELTQSHD